MVFSLRSSTAAAKAKSVSLAEWERASLQCLSGSGEALFISTSRLPERGFWTGARMRRRLGRG